MRKILFSLFLFLLLFSSSASAWEDSAVYDTDISEKWTILVPMSGGVSIVSDPTGVADNTVIYMGPSTHYADVMYIRSIYPIPAKYISWIHKGGVRNGDGAYIYEISDYATGEKLFRFYVSSSRVIPPNSKMEIVFSSSTVDLFRNGELIQSVVNPGIAQSDTVRLTFGVTAGGYFQKSMYIDDITTSSMIGISKLCYESKTNITFTWSSQLMRSYQTQQRIDLYSLTNPNNAGIVKTWNIPQEDDSTTSEHGYISFSRSEVIGDNFGLYLLEMSRGSDVLTDQYFYFDQLANPTGYPEILFIGESSVKTEIRDENHNGGEIQGGGAVYLYPKIKEDAAYNFTYNILEAPYKIKTELTTVYNNTPINSTTINFSGLSNQNYKISVDGADTGSTNGTDTFSHTFSDWSTEKNHIISFAPDYTIAGVWGEVKNSETQQGIKSATVSISGANFSKTLYTDDNGLYYLTKGMEPGKTYTITVSKTGYTTPPSQTAITADGSTTRQDFYMDKIPGVDGEGIYYSPHNVRFVVTDRYLFERYDANVTISGENVTTETQRTGTDGVCVFKMSENTRYEIVTEYNGMKQTDYISPIEYSYYIILDATKTSLLPTSQFYEMCNITITKNELNSSHAEIAVSYSDNGSDTNSVYFTLGKTDGNNTMSAIETSPTGNGNMTYTFVVHDYTGEDYVVKVNVDHNKFGNVEKQYGVNFPGSKLPFTGNAIIALCVLIFFVVAMQWGKADAHMGAVLICGLGWWFYYLDIFRKLGDGTNAVIGTGLGLATVYAILSMINRKRDEGGI